MKQVFYLILGIVFLFSPAHAVLLTFDDIPGGSIQGSVGDMPIYQGFVFSSTADWIDVVASSWSFGAYSGEFAILNNNGGAAIVNKSDSTDFTFDGVWAKAWNTSPQSGGSTVVSGTIRGYNNGIQIWSISTGLNGSYQFFAGQTQAIDQLYLDFGNHFLVDNLALNQTVPVPEPAILILVAFGLGLAGIRKMGRKN